MQLHTDFATHISELEQPLARPYSEPIDSSLLDSQADIQYLNKEVSSINPDYMTFFPAYFWLFYFAIGWVYFSTSFYVISLIADIQYFYLDEWTIFNVLISLFGFFVMFLPFLILLYQLIRRNPIRTQYYFLKKEQKIAYYYRPLWKLKQPYELKIVDYKDIIPDLHQDKYNQAYTPLNLYVADEETGNITHHMKLEDYNVNPHVQWAFIRTYMESPAEDMPIDPKICQAYPADTSGSLFACSDIKFRKSFDLNSKHQGDGIIAMMFLGSAFVLGYLLQGNNYQCSKQAILHPEVKKLLTWDGKNNPYPIAPITPQAEKAFKGKNWQVNIRWIIAIVVNAFFFGAFIYAFNS
ncbi:DUF6708 domain-containing protein [Psychrobacter sp. I-STPA6b]|uniref:DUF6708 domain-containing protein n=1 Tax=Psychrobacter sp. I-STPA6b TaxID=2585718 RepID=UPI001D0CBDD4|nr:DUF6708 domain-containing protein [Psychrobacter sp. I-STPA6b]